MDDSLKEYLGTKTSAALEEYLDALIARPGRKNPFVGFGVDPCDKNYRFTKIDATGNNVEVWTHVGIIVKGKIDRSTAEKALEKIDKEINEILLEQKRPRVSYSLDDDSDTLYQAKSNRIKGTEPIASGSQERQVYKERLDPPLFLRLTRGYRVNTKFVEIELGSDKK